MSKANEKSKKLGLKEAISIVIGVVIGSGVFFKTSIVFQQAGAPGLGILAWVLAGVITICSGLTIAEVGSAIPKEGGLIAYLKDLYGDVWSFLYGWVEGIIYYPATIAAAGIIFATQTTYFFPGLTSKQQTMLALGLIVFLTIIHIISTKFGGKIQVISTVGKVLPLLAIIVFGLARGTAHSFTPLVSSQSSVTGFGAALLGVLWAYNGWISVGAMAEEMDNPSKNLPKAIIIGLSLVIAIYVVFNIAIINILPMNQVIASQQVASDAATVIFGKFGADLVSIGILISVFGALNGNIMTGARTPMAMAKQKLYPFHKHLSKTHDKFGTPHNAIIFISAIACVFTIFGSFETLTNLVVFVLWIFFVLGVAGVFILRKRPNKHEGYKVPLYPIVPLIGIFGGAYVVINTVITNPKNALAGVIITLLGLPVYYYITKVKK